MAGITITSANRYAKMSSSFYKEYLIINEKYQKALSSYEEGLMQDYEICALLSEKEEKAIAAVVFQAFAIEAYVNMLGITVFGELEFYEKYVRKSTHEKAKKIFKALSSKEYPKDHNEKIKALFEKRDSLVHQKPHRFTVKVQPFDQDHPEEGYKEYLEFCKSFEYLFSNLEEQMTLYSEFQENIRKLRGAEKELIEELSEQEMKENIGEMFDAVHSMLGIKSDGETL